MLRVIAAAAILTVLLACQPETPSTYVNEPIDQSTTPEYMNSNPRAPYSEGVRYGGLIFLAGKTGGPGEPGVQAETRRTLEAIQDALQRFGSSMDRVVKCKVYLVDMAEWSAMNEVYAEFFPNNKPARTAVGISLGGDTRVEIECIAAA
jgi:2-iminobutanoate/2-iminopropanoate deaminase